MGLEASRNPRLKLLRDFGLNQDTNGLSCTVVQDKGKQEQRRGPVQATKAFKCCGGLPSCWHYSETDDDLGAVEVFVDSDWDGWFEYEAACCQ